MSSSSVGDVPYTLGSTNGVKEALEPPLLPMPYCRAEQHVQTYWLYTGSFSEGNTSAAALSLGVSLIWSEFWVMLEDFMGRGSWKTEGRKEEEFVQSVAENTGTRVRIIKV